MQRHSLLRATLLALATLMAAPAVAAEAPQAPQKAPASIDVTDKDVQNFAEAHKEVMKVRQQYISKAKNTEGKKQRTQLKLAMQKDMLQAVQESGMKPKRYNQVARQVAQDKELRERVQSELRE